MHTENEKIIWDRYTKIRGARWAGINRYDRNVEENIPALNRNTIGTIIINENSERLARFAQEEENEKRLYCDGLRMDDGYVEQD
jgi:hypothetical protein